MASICHVDDVDNKVTQARALLDVLINGHCDDVDGTDLNTRYSSHYAQWTLIYNLIIKFNSKIIITWTWKWDTKTYQEVNTEKGWKRRKVSFNT